jgi:hypothetical protein
VKPGLLLILTAIIQSLCPSLNNYLNARDSQISRRDMHHKTSKQNYGGFTHCLMNNNQLMEMAISFDLYDHHDAYRFFRLMQS